MWIIVCTVIIAVIFGGDMWIKNRIERTEAEGKTRKILGGRLIIGKHHNRGAILNLGQKNRPLVACVSVAMTGVMFVLFVLSLGRHGNGLLRVALSMILGGAFSNTYDRLKRKYVVDYVSFNTPGKYFKRVIFYISDFCIIIGALLATFAVGR